MINYKFLNVISLPEAAIQKKILYIVILRKLMYATRRIKSDYYMQDRLSINLNISITPRFLA